MNLDIKIDGLDKLIEKLGKATAQETLEQPMTQGAYLLAAWSQKNRLSGPRPTYLGVVTNRLRSSISVSRAINREEFKFFIGTNVVYASIHEFGGMAGRNNKVRIPARPFLRPAIEDEGNQNDIVTLVTKKINEALSKQ